MELLIILLFIIIALLSAVMYRLWQLPLPKDNQMQRVSVFDRIKSSKVQFVDPVSTKEKINQIFETKWQDK